MKLFFVRIIFTTFICYSFFVSNAQRRPKHSANPCTDTARYVILPFNKSILHIPFSDSCQAATLSESEISEIEKLLNIAVSEHNASLKDGHKYPYIDPQVFYRRQFIPVINASGEKEVWINCFCLYWDTFCNYWRKDIVMVDDGGTCFFNTKINLTTKRIYDFFVNGSA